MFPRSAAIFLALSLVLHAGTVATLYYPAFVRQMEEPASVQIEYIESQPAPKIVEEKKPPKVSPEKPAPLLVKSKEAIVSRRVMPSKEAQTAKPAVLSQNAQKSVERKPIRRTLAPAKPAPAVAKSENLLADPEKGKIFTSYFAKIKEKIQNRVQRKYSYENIGGGNVTLLFVLDKDGSLDSVSVLEKHSTGSSDVKDFAVQCVRDSAPFDRFPPDLGLNKISFNLTVLFQEV